MRKNDHRRAAIVVASVVAGVTTFLIVLQLSFFLSRSHFLAIGLAAWAAYFVYHYLPVHFIMRYRPDLMHPQPRAYQLRPIDALAGVKTALSREYIEGKSWIDKTQDKERRELVFVCKFQEPIASDKGVGSADIELQLLVSVSVVSSLTMVQLDYKLSDPQPNQLANDLCKATTEFVEKSLLYLEESQKCRH